MKDQKRLYLPNILRFRRWDDPYVVSLLAAGKADGDFLSISNEDFRRIHEQFPQRGLGTLVASIAKPIAGAIDAILGTDLTNCNSCKEREKKLNEKFPLGRAARAPRGTREGACAPRNLKI